jgi:hypothetical protein
LCSIVVTTYFCFVADLQLIEHDDHNPSAADLQLIRAEHLPNAGVNVVALTGTTTGAINIEPNVRHDRSNWQSFIS